MRITPTAHKDYRGRDVGYEIVRAEVQDITGDSDRKGEQGSDPAET